MVIDFSLCELDRIIEMMCELAMGMDDDGRDGAFAASPLAPILKKFEKAREEKR